MKLHQKIFKNPLLATGVLFATATLVFAAPPATPYNANETLDPSCAPGDTNCIVQLNDNDFQNLSLIGTNLSIERGNSIDLSSIIPATSQYAQTVFIDTVTPSTATIFDTNSPASINTPSLASDSNNIYIGTDGSSWVWNGSTYITKVISDNTAWKLNNTEIDASASKTGDIWRNGKIGVGTYATNTITSSGSVRINMDSSVPTANTLVLYNPNQASTAGNSIAFRALMDNGNNREMAYIRAQYTDHADATRSADMYFSTASGAAAQNRMVIKNNGNIGFGTITPGSSFSLNGIDQSVPLAAGRNFPAILDINSTNTASGSESNILFTSNYVGVSKVANASIASLKETSGSNADYGQASLIFRTSGNSIATLNTEKMRIMGNGNIGIGTTSPAYKLHVNDTLDGNISTRVQNTHSGASAYASINVQSDDSTGYMGAFSSTYGNGNLQDSFVIRSGSNTSSGILINSPTAPIRFSTAGNANTQMILANGGNVGIGTINPMHKLHVKDGSIFIDNTSNTNYLYLGQNGTGLDILTTKTGNDLGLGTGFASQLYIKSNGNVGIGLTNPSEKLEVNGYGKFSSSIKLPGAGASSTGYYACIDGTTGEIYKGGGACSLSDIRLKRDITNLESSDSLVKVLGLQGVTFKWKEGFRGEATNIGFIAQDVEKLFPEAVTENPDGMKAMNYEFIIAPLVEAVKELYNKLTSNDEDIATLKKVIELQQQQMEYQQSQIDYLKTKIN